jgi:hypothetical protein
MTAPTLWKSHSCPSFASNKPPVSGRIYPRCGTGKPVYSAVPKAFAKTCYQQSANKELIALNLGDDFCLSPHSEMSWRSWD